MLWLVEVLLGNDNALLSLLVDGHLNQHSKCSKVLVQRILVISPILLSNLVWVAFGGIAADWRAGRRRLRRSRSAHIVHTLKEVLVDLLSLFSGNKHDGLFKLLWRSAQAYEIRTFFFSIMKILSLWRTAYGVEAVAYVINKGGDEGSAGKIWSAQKQSRVYALWKPRRHVFTTTWVGSSECSTNMASVSRFAQSHHVFVFSVGVLVFMGFWVTKYSGWPTWLLIRSKGVSNL